jgi:hypothetical protein
MRLRAQSMHAGRLLAARFDRLFEGTVPAWIYAWLRIGTAAIFLSRNADWLRPILSLEHHRFVRGLLFFDSTAAEPRLSSPLLPGLELSDAASRALIYARTALAVLLLLGVRARASAALLALVSFLLLASDRYRYYHHLYLLYLTVGWLALAPTGSVLGVERPLARLFASLRGRAAPAPARLQAPEPVWPLQLVRALVLSVYLAAGASKLDAGFLAGDALRELERYHILKGPFWEAARATLGYGGVAKLACLLEFALPAGLLHPVTRRAAVLAGMGFHAGISASMPVYTFGAQMAVLLLSFCPRARSAFSETEAPRARH